MGWFRQRDHGGVVGFGISLFIVLIEDNLYTVPIYQTIVHYVNALALSTMGLSKSECAMDNITKR